MHALGQKGSPFQPTTTTPGALDQKRTAQEAEVENSTCRERTRFDHQGAGQEEVAQPGGKIPTGSPQGSSAQSKRYGSAAQSGKRGAGGAGGKKEGDQKRDLEELIRGIEGVQIEFPTD